VTNAIIAAAGLRQVESAFEREVEALAEPLLRRQHAVTGEDRETVEAVIADTLAGRSPRVEVAQGERTLWSGRLRRLMPGRSTRLPWRWTSEVDLSGEPVVCRLRRPG